MLDSNGSSGMSMLGTNLYQNILVQQQFSDPAYMAQVVCTLLAPIILFALPSVRGAFHDLFENSHRYLSWTVIPILFLHVAAKVTSTHQQQQQQDIPLDLVAALLRCPDAWAVLGIALLVYHPWAFVSQEKVSITVPQPNFMVIDGFRGHTAAGLFGRISKSRWGQQWHPFAVISGPVISGPREQKREPSLNEAQHPEHRIMIARAGDWTSELIDQSKAGSPPQEMYIRHIKAPGFMYTTRMWRNIVCVASGAGIAPVLPCLMQGVVPSMTVIWITSNPASFGPVVGLLNEYNKGKCTIHDTKVQGRPDTVSMTIKAVIKEKAEAVYIVANQHLTFSVVKGCTAVGINAFGAIWDS